VNWGEKRSPALESETAAPRRDGRGRTGLSSRGNRWFYLARRRLLRLSHPFGIDIPPWIPFSSHPLLFLFINNLFARERYSMHKPRRYLVLCPLQKRKKRVVVD